MQGLALLDGSLSGPLGNFFPHVLESLHVVLVASVEVASLAEIEILAGEAVEPSAEDWRSLAAVAEVAALRRFVGLALLQVVHRVLHGVEGCIVVLPYIVKMRVVLDLL